MTSASVNCCKFLEKRPFTYMNIQRFWSRDCCDFSVTLDRFYRASNTKSTCHEELENRIGFDLSLYHDKRIHLLVDSISVTDGTTRAPKERTLEIIVWTWSICIFFFFFFHRQSNYKLNLTFWLTTSANIDQFDMRKQIVILWNLNSYFKFQFFKLKINEYRLRITLHLTGRNRLR